MGKSRVIAFTSSTDGPDRMDRTWGAAVATTREIAAAPYGRKRTPDKSRPARTGTTVTVPTRGDEGELTFPCTTVHPTVNEWDADFTALPYTSGFPTH
jgi:hypothetical protein